MSIIFTVSTAILLLKRKGIQASPLTGDDYSVTFGGNFYTLSKEDLKKIGVDLKINRSLSTIDIENLLKNYSKQL